MAARPPRNGRSDGEALGEGRRPRFLVLGLGNPGADYERTRHNLGFRVIDALAGSLGASPRNGPGPSLVCPVEIGGEEGLLAKPLTWMNRSGRAAKALLEWGQGPPLERLLVVLDDLDLPLGRLRFRRRGGNGGHNGLSSIIDELGSREIPRLRLGIGRPDAAERQDVVDWVLQPFSTEEERLAADIVEKSVEAVRTFVIRGIEHSMNRYNAEGGRSPTEETQGPDARRPSDSAGDGTKRIESNHREDEP
jgi:PTH1 family peptidyl-tRNA hydrolase